MTRQYEIKLHEFQEAGIFSDRRFIFLISGIQGGKTTAGALWFKQEIHRHPKDNFLIVTPTYKLMDQSTLPKFRQFMAGAGRYNEQKAIYRLKAGGVVYCRSGEDPDAIEGIPNVRAAWMDECGKLKYRAWVNTQGRLSILQGRAMGTTTPYAMNWLYKDVYTPFKEGDKDTHVIQFESIENPVFPREEYERMRGKLDPRIFDMRYRGIFGRMAGLVYPDFGPNKVIEPFKFGPGTKFCAGVDWGFSDPCAIIVIAVVGRRVYIVDEWYEQWRTISQVKAAAKQLREIWPIEMFYCDNANPGNIQEFNDAKLPAIGVDKGPGSVEYGINKVTELIREDNLYVFAGRCPNTEDEFDLYHYPEDTLILMHDRPPRTDPVDMDNHAMDGIRYAITATLFPKTRTPHVAIGKEEKQQPEFIRRRREQMRRQQNESQDWYSS